MDTTLRDALLRTPTRGKVVTDLDQAVAAQVKATSGLSGAAARTGYQVAQKVRPGFIASALDGLLPEFAAALQPWWEEYPGHGGFGRHLAQDGPAAADALLAITDGRAASTERTALRKAYRSLRPKAAVLVEDALPRVGDVIERHAS